MMNKQNKIGPSDVFLYFFRISWFTFGGGWSIVAQMQKDFVDDHPIMTAEELLDIVSVGRSLPGTMIGNVAYLFGYRQCGVLGGILATVGMVLPPMLILSVLTYCYGAVKDNIWVAKMLAGVRTAVVPIMACAAWKLGKAAFSNGVCYLICIGGCIMAAVFHMNSVLVILAGMFVGIVMGRRKEASA